MFSRHVFVPGLRGVVVSKAGPLSLQSLGRPGSDRGPVSRSVGVGLLMCVRWNSSGVLAAHSEASRGRQ